ncbi:hypothetical protein ACHAXS_007140 [Conticribra weissflogii]
MIDIGILEECRASERALPCFIVAKKDGRVRQISDLHSLNKCIKHKQNPLHIIHDIMQWISGYKFFTKLDILIQHYTFELDEESQELCVIITPIGKYKYKHLPMGLKCAPDFVQQIMEQVLHGINNAFVYLDDIGIFSKTWEEHLLTFERMLSCLKANGFTVNPFKCEWAIQETDWLGYWLTPIGLKPCAIIEQQPPCNLKEMSGFLGVVNTYWLMWPKQAHLLKPLSDNSGKNVFVGPQKWIRLAKS